MKELGCSYEIWDFPDGLDIKWNEKKAMKKIKRILDSKKDWEIVLTHNSDGEYGHYQHKQLNYLLSDIYKKNNFYVPIKTEYLADKLNQLPDDLKNRKYNLISGHYKSQEFVLDRYHKYLEYESLVIGNKTLGI